MFLEMDSGVFKKARDESKVLRKEYSRTTQKD